MSIISQVDSILSHGAVRELGYEIYSNGLETLKVFNSDGEFLEISNRDFPREWNEIISFVKRKSEELVDEALDYIRNKYYLKFGVIPEVEYIIDRGVVITDRTNNEKWIVKPDPVEFIDAETEGLRYRILKIRLIDQYELEEYL